MVIRLILALFLAFSMLPAEAKEPISFKVKFAIKTSILFVPRVIKSTITDGIHPLQAIDFGLKSEIYNMRCRGQGYEDFTFFSWGD